MRNGIINRIPQNIIYGIISAAMPIVKLDYKIILHSLYVQGEAKEENQLNFSVTIFTLDSLAFA
jgi:hypothetical protein